MDGDEAAASEVPHGTKMLDEKIPMEDTAMGYIDGLELSWKKKWQTDLDAALLNSKRMPIMVVSTRHELCIVDNFVSHAESLALDLYILHVGLDEEAYANC